MKELLENIKSILDFELESATELYENFYCEGLNINTIEAEGYLRAIKTIRNEIYKEIEYSDFEKECGHE